MTTQHGRMIARALVFSFGVLQSQNMFTGILRVTNPERNAFYWQATLRWAVREVICISQGHCFPWMQILYSPQPKLCKKKLQKKLRCAQAFIIHYLKESHKILSNVFSVHFLWENLDQKLLAFIILHSLCVGQPLFEQLAGDRMIVVLIAD